LIVIIHWKGHPLGSIPKPELIGIGTEDQQTFIADIQHGAERSAFACIEFWDEKTFAARLEMQDSIRVRISDADADIILCAANGKRGKA
jgi:hypothetical protein